MDTTLSSQTLAQDPERRFWLLATGVAGGAAAIATSVPGGSAVSLRERLAVVIGDAALA